MLSLALPSVGTLLGVSLSSKRLALNTTRWAVQTSAQHITAISGSLMVSLNDSGRKIDFFVSGVQKGGTTALVTYLRSHPAVRISTVKETHFFDSEEINWDNPDLRRLHSYFDWSEPNVLARGEATPITIYWPNALARIYRYNPSAKIIILLRHPTFRAYSRWRMQVVRNAEILTFEDAIADGGRRRVRESPGGVNRAFSYVERGFYAAQIRRLQDLFPPEQILFLRTEDLWLFTQRVIQRVESFIGVPQSLKVSADYIVPVDSSDLEQMSAVAKEELCVMYAEEISETRKLTGLDLLHWNCSDYVEPMAK